MDGSTLGAAIALIKKNKPTDEQIESAVSDWLEENITNPDSPPLDRSLSASSAAAPADIVGNLKNAIDALEGGTTGQVLRKKSGTDFDVEWADNPNAEEISTAVDDWLDEHPEATTTVQDGSLTEAKFTAETLNAIKNNFVTPEMFGAKGDGTTDDTEAIQDMFDSESTIFAFSSKTYLVDGSIDIEKTCTIFFNRTVLLAKKSYAVRSFEYVVGFKAKHIKTFGKLIVRANDSVNIGILFSGAGSSFFDELGVTNARIWGMYVDKTSNDNNGIDFNSITSSNNGFKLHGKAKYSSEGILDVIEINTTGGYSGLSNAVRETLLDNRYYQNELIIDDSLYTRLGLANRLVFRHTGNGESFTFVGDDYTAASFSVNSAGPKVPSDYNDNGGYRDVYIPVGGGFRFESAASEGVFSINQLTTQSNPISMYCGWDYGGNINVYSSEYDTIVLHNEAYNLNINYMYSEAVGNGYKNLFDSQFDKIILFTQTSNKKVYVQNPFIGLNRIPYMQGNSVINYIQFNESQFPETVLVCTNFLAANKLQGANVNREDDYFIWNIDEYTPRTITVDANGYGQLEAFPYNIKINLIDVNAYRNGKFDPIVMYVKRRRNDSVNKDLIITLDNNLISQGYSIRGAINNNLSVDISEFNNFAKITIMLFENNKRFYVTAEGLTFVNNNQVIDTTPIILEYDKAYRPNPSTNPPIETTGVCITDVYTFEPTASNRGIVTYGAKGNMLVYNNNQYSDYWALSSYEQEQTRTNVIAAGDNAVAFTLDTDSLLTCYAYIPETGEILFAGENSEYYGHQNISELN